MQPQSAEVLGLPPIVDIRDPFALTTLREELRGRRVCLTDVDQTLAQTVSALMKESAYRGVPISRKDIVRYDVSHAIAAVHNMPFEKARELLTSIFSESSFFANLEVFWPMFSALYELKELDYKIIAITNRRKSEERAPGITQQWLYENAIPCDKVIFATPEEKVWLISQLADVSPGSIFIDDHPPTLALAEAQIPQVHPIRSFLIRREWSPNGVTEDDIVEYAKSYAIFATEFDEI